MNRSLTLSLLAAAGLAAALPLTAQPMQKPGSPNPALVSAGTYKLDPGHTQAVWTVDHLGFTPYSGIFGDISGTVTLDPANLATAKVDVTVPVAKVTTPSAGLTAHLLKPAAAGGKPDFFGAAPADARFVSTKVTSTSATTARIDGELTLNGVTKPVTIDAAFYGAGKLPPMMGGKDGLGFTGKATILRSQFGIGYAIPIVSDEVKLDIALGLMKL
jgi:polyisoprenoid-binding protein YceI